VHRLIVELRAIKNRYLAESVKLTSRRAGSVRGLPARRAGDRDPSNGRHHPADRSETSHVTLQEALGKPQRVTSTPAPRIRKRIGGSSEHRRHRGAGQGGVRILPSGDGSDSARSQLLKSGDHVIVRQTSTGARAGLFDKVP